MSETPKPSPYYTDQGPEDGPILADDDRPHQIDVYADDGPEWPIGSATCLGLTASPWGEVALYQVRIGRDDKPGLNVVVARRFVPAAEWPPD